MSSKPVYATIYWEDASLPGGNEIIIVDATISEKHTGSVELTKYPVEKGISPADHAREAPERITIDGVFTATPLGMPPNPDQPNINPLQVRAEMLLMGKAGAGEPRLPGWPKKQFDLLRGLKASHLPVKVGGPWRDYKNMVLVQLDATRDSKLGDAIKFSATFEQVRFVSSKQAQLKATSTSVPAKTTGTVKQGTKAAEKADAGSKTKSWAVDLGL
jgi:hypothetical protein